MRDMAYDLAVACAVTDHPKRVGAAGRVLNRTQQREQVEMLTRYGWPADRPLVSILRYSNGDRP